MWTFPIHSCSGCAPAQPRALYPTTTRWICRENSSLMRLGFRKFPWHDGASLPTRRPVQIDTWLSRPSETSCRTLPCPEICGLGGLAQSWIFRPASKHRAESVVSSFCAPNNSGDSLEISPSDGLAFGPAAPPTLTRFDLFAGEMARNRAQVQDIEPCAS